MSEELEIKLKEVFNTFLYSRVNEIVAIFQREFSEQNVDFKIDCTCIDSFQEGFCDEFLKNFSVCRIDNSQIKLCSRYYKSVHNLTHLYNIDEIEEFGEYSLDEVFNTLDTSDLIESMSGFIRNAYIYVHFPIVKITNERGQFTYVKDLFAKVYLRTDGRMIYDSYFKLNRSHYTYAHFINNYMHSHVSNIPKTDFSIFQSCCTGTGPIKTTMENLVEEYNESQWIQFCWDLAKYVTIESEEGIPYHHLNRCNYLYTKNTEITRGVSILLKKDNFNSLAGGNKFSSTFWSNFIKYLIDNKVIKFRWVNKQWEIANSPVEHIKCVSNAFLEYYKENINTEFHHTIDELFASNVLKKVIIDITGVYLYSESHNANIDLEEYRNRFVVNFKGVTYNTVIENPPENDGIHVHTILNIYTIMFITGCLLQILNTKYGEVKNNSSEPEIPFENF